jgi:hypothetical protein
MLEMPPSHVDEIRVIELQLARHTSNLIVFDGEDRCIRRADLEKAIQEVQLFFASRAALEFTGDEKVLSASRCSCHVAGESNNRGGVRLGDASFSYDDLAHPCRFTVRDFVISPRRSRQDVGETGKMPDAVGAKSGESGFDFLEAVARIGCVSRDTQPIPERRCRLSHCSYSVPGFLPVTATD